MGSLQETEHLWNLVLEYGSFFLCNKIMRTQCTSWNLLWSKAFVKRLSAVKLFVFGAAFYTAAFTCFPCNTARRRDCTTWQHSIINWTDHGSCLIRRCIGPTGQVMRHSVSCCLTGKIHMLHNALQEMNSCMLVAKKSNSTELAWTVTSTCAWT